MHYWEAYFLYFGGDCIQQCSGIIGGSKHKDHFRRFWGTIYGSRMEPSSAYCIASFFMLYYFFNPREDIDKTFNFFCLWVSPEHKKVWFKYIYTHIMNIYLLLLRSSRLQIHPSKLDIFYLEVLCKIIKIMWRKSLI